ncbi:MAG: homing endonuclease associated repeat-containing protein [Christensenellales bacterium]|jgi:5-methylcytosine-specific restriction endonuclease McrA
MKVGAFMKFELNEYHRNTSDEELIEDLKRVAKLLQKDSVTIDDYNQYGQFHATTLTRRFKSWFCCLEKAELKMSRSLLNISDEDLFEEIERVWVCIGKQPSYAQMRDSSKYSVGTYEKRFGGWRASLESFINYINSIDENSQEATDKTDVKFDNQHKTSRTINLRLRFLIFSRDNFKCCACGASPAKDPSVELHIDHIIPWAKGGETVIDNLQTLCSKCNLGKGDME